MSYKKSLFSKEKRRKRNKYFFFKNNKFKNLLNLTLNNNIKKRSKNNFTVSIAIPSSIINNIQSLELKTYLIGQIARTLTIYKVDEIIIFSEDEISLNSQKKIKYNNPSFFFARILQYLETPQYLRKKMFPIHSNLRYAGILNPLNAPHHLLWNEKSRYREAIVEKNENEISYVNVGWKKRVQLNKILLPGTRITVDFKQKILNSKIAKLIPCYFPRIKNDLYWGYQVRLVKGLINIFKGTFFSGGYDYIIGTSERGKNIQNPNFNLPLFKHLLIVFGGIKGLENLKINEDKCGRPDKIFDQYVNICSNQGSRIIRLEEALLITLSVIQTHIQINNIS